MVAVGVCDKYTFQMHHFFPQHLFAEVGTDVYQDILALLSLYERSCSKMLVVDVSGLAYCTLASLKMLVSLLVLYRKSESHAMHIDNLYSGVNF